MEQRNIIDNIGVNNNITCRNRVTRLNVY